MAMPRRGTRLQTRLAAQAVNLVKVKEEALIAAKREDEEDSEFNPSRSMLAPEVDQDLLEGGEEDDDDDVIIVPLSITDPEAAMWHHHFIERWYARGGSSSRDYHFRLRRKTPSREAAEARLRRTRKEIAERCSKVQRDMASEVSDLRQQVDAKRAGMEKDAARRDASMAEWREQQKKLQTEQQRLEERRASILEELQALTPDEEEDPTGILPLPASSSSAAPALIAVKKQSMDRPVRASALQRRTEGGIRQKPIRISSYAARKPVKVAAKEVAAAPVGVRPVKPSSALPLRAKKIQKPEQKAPTTERRAIAPKATHKAGSISRTLASRARARAVGQASSSGRPARESSLFEPVEFIGEPVGKAGKTLKVKQPPAGSFGIIHGAEVGDIGVDLPPHIEFIGEPVGKGMKVASSGLLPTFR